MTHPLSKVFSRTVLLLALVAPACSSGGGGGDAGTAGPTPQGEFVADGMLQLSGADTAAFGTVLTVGDVALLTGGGQPDTYMCLDANSSISGFEYEFGNNQQLGNIVLGDVLNNFVINVIDGTSMGITGISMKITANGVDYDYTCVNCPGLSFDTGAMLILFDDVEVQPQGAATDTLVLDGTIRWGIPQ